VYVVGFIIRIYHDARSPERQIHYFLTTAVFTVEKDSMEFRHHIKTEGYHHHHHHICHGVVPLFDPFRSLASTSLFKGLP